MQPKFNFYDFAAYIIPGTLGIFFVWAFLSRVLGISPISLEAVSGFSGSVLFLILLYLAGHVLQAFGRFLEQKEVRRKGWPSQRFLRPDDSHYSREFKDQLIGAATEYFSLKSPPLGEQGDVTRMEQWRQELFRLCYALLTQKGIAQQVEVHNGLYGLWRGLLVSFQLGSGVFLAESIKHAWLLQMGSLAMSIFATVLLGLSWKFSRSRMQHFGERFADSVYHNFLAYYQGTKEVR